MGESNFDKKGFFFFLKFTALIFVLFFSVKYGPRLADSNLIIATNGGPQKEAQIAGLVALKRYDETKKTYSAPKRLTLGFVGDIMLDRGIKSSVEKYGNSDYIFPFEKVKNYLNSFDILFGNLEGPISDRGTLAGSIYSFRMNPRSAKSLKEAGFGILSVANNHIGDWGRTAMKDTFQNLNNAGIIYSGGGNNKEEAYEVKKITAGDTKIAYLAFSEFGKGYLEAGENTAGIAIISDEKLKSGIEKAKAENDIVIVSFHFGDEYKKEPNAYQKSVAHKAIDYGADLVVGHHPHVVEPIEVYKDKYIAYSLGNFVFDQHFSKETMEGVALKATVENKKITEVSSDKIVINKHYQPELETNSSE
ncbi:MAG: CapA family protein [Patescibacteria group bacterium]|nr:CapA family protein [Patescibacteria group bacterium]MDE1988700.1 CapA family protein [Patescibacteria group bacterium]MDE2218404.1 CapA family protein [Patescibacteria group bacterium]